MIRSSRLLVLAVLPALLFLSACEVTDPLEDVNLLLDVDDAVVDLGSGIVVSVQPGSPSAATETVRNDFDVASVEELRAVRLKPEFFAFAAAGAGKQAGVRSTGTIAVYVFVAGIPLPNTPITLTIENSVVRSVSPNTINLLGTTYDVDRSTIEAFFEDLPPEEQPDLKAWQTMTIDEVRNELNAALSSSAFPIAIGTIVSSSDPNDPLTGSLELQLLSFDARVSK